MSVSRNRARKQSDSVPQANQSHGTGNDPQPVLSAMTPSAGGTIGHHRPVPCTFSLTITDLDPRDLTALLQALCPANDAEPGPDQPCVCPHCGHSHGRYDPQASAVLDCLVIATEALHEAKRLVEEEVLP